MLPSPVPTAAGDVERMTDEDDDADGGAIRPEDVPPATPVVMLPPAARTGWCNACNGAEVDDVVSVLPSACADNANAAVPGVADDVAELFASVGWLPAARWWCEKSALLGTARPTSACNDEASRTPTAALFGSTFAEATSDTFTPDTDDASVDANTVDVAPAAAAGAMETAPGGCGDGVVGVGVACATAVDAVQIDGGPVDPDGDGTDAAFCGDSGGCSEAVSSSDMTRPCAWLWWYFSPLANLYFLLQSCSGHSSSTGEIGHGSTVVLIFLAGICTFNPVNGLMRLLVSPRSVHRPRPDNDPLGPLPLPPLVDELLLLSSLDLRFSGRGGRNVVGDVEGVFETVLVPELAADDEEWFVALPETLEAPLPPPRPDPPADDADSVAFAFEPLPLAEPEPAVTSVPPLGPPTDVRHARPLAPPLRSLLCTCTNETYKLSSVYRKQNTKQKPQSARLQHNHTLIVIR